MKYKNLISYNSVPDGLIMNVKVLPSSKINKISFDDDRNLRVKLTKTPTNNEANKQLLKDLSIYLKVRLQDLKIIAGHKSRTKKVFISISAEELKNVIISNLRH